MMIPLLIILTAALLRLLPHEPNIAPIGAMALFGGAYLTRKYALLLPLIALFLSDLVLGFHSTIIWVYGSFILIGLLGMWLKRRPNCNNILLASFAGSCIFYLITNFGVWFSTSLYPKTFDGLAQSYLMGLPFFKNTIIGDILYNGLFFGGYAVVYSWIRGKLKLQLLQK